MTRRELLAAAAATAAWAATAASGRGQHQGAPHPRSSGGPDAFIGTPDATLRIGPLNLEIAPGRVVKTIGYNGQVPGPVLRARQGRPFNVEVWNDTADEDIVHWHGLHIPSEVDGAYEEGTPGVPPRGGRRRYTFVPDPVGTRWYHSHNHAGTDLKRSTYTGQFGMLVVEGADEPGAYDQEVPLLLHEWEPRFTTRGPRDVEFKYHSINGKILGGGEPIRVREGQRILFRIVNASATLEHQLALPGHQFQVVALDGNAVPKPSSVPMLDLAPGERVDALVTMNQPGVWILGGVKTANREAGLGVVVEYAGATGPPRWQAPVPSVWDYTVFGGRDPAPEPDGRLTLAFRAREDGHHWMINGKSYPKTDPIVVQPNRRYRWLLDNQSADPHPIHLHRHTFELVRIVDRPTSGVWKDVVVVPAWKQVEIDVPTTQPGLTLLHCHQQFHMDMGFMTLLRYA
jgi:FtsP/CotA-like multicopper oxidase with cupredoxin domain